MICTLILELLVLRVKKTSAKNVALKLCDKMLTGFSYKLFLIIGLQYRPLSGSQRKGHFKSPVQRPLLKIDIFNYF